MDYIASSNDTKYTQEGLRKPAKLNPSGLSLSRFDDALRLLKDQGGKILDVSSGNGFFALGLENYFNEIHGVDVSQVAVNFSNKMIEKYAEQKEKFTFKKVETSKGYTYKKNYFDVITVLHCLEHVLDPFFFIKELKRVLKPGGRLLISVPNLGFFYFRLAVLFGRLPRTSWRPVNMKIYEDIGWDAGHIHYFTKKSLALLLKYFDFKIIKWSGGGKFAKIRRLWPSLLTAEITVLVEKIK